MPVKELSAIKYEVKKSRFYAYLYTISGMEDVELIAAALRKKYRNADHICSAVRFRDGGSMLHEEWKNDGEVGRPGTALLELLRTRALERHMIVVVRVFGGIKLGPGNVTRAFRHAGNAAFDEYTGNRDLP